MVSAQIDKELLDRLKLLKPHRNASYNDVIRMLLNEHEVKNNKDEN